MSSLRMRKHAMQSSRRLRNCEMKAMKSMNRQRQRIRSNERVVSDGQLSRVKQEDACIRRLSGWGSAGHRAPSFFRFLQKAVDLVLNPLRIGWRMIAKLPAHNGD